LRRAHGGDQRRLARVREADQRGVGEQLHLQSQPPLLAVLALFGEARRAPRVREKSCVPPAAATAARRDVTVAGVDGIGEPRPVAPSGTHTAIPAPVARCRRFRLPCLPEAARRCGWPRTPSRDATLRSASNTTSPPAPPSPPSGPPFGTCASRRNETAPAPP